MKSMVEITFEGPCAGRLQRILELVDVEPSMRNPSVAAHLRSCGRCSAFVESLQHERQALRGTSAFPPRISTKKPDLLRGIDRWLIDKLRVRSDQELAKALTAVARALMHESADYSDCVDSISSQVDELSDSDSICTTAQVAGTLLGRSESRRRLQKQTASTRIAAATVARAIRRLETSRPASVLARELVDFAISVSPGCSLAWQLRGLISWFLEPESDVLSSFCRAQETACTPQDVAMSLNNRSLYAADSGNIGSALRLSDASLSATPLVPVIATRVIWGEFFESEGASERHLRSLQFQFSLERVSRSLNVTTILRRSKFIAEVYDMPQSRAKHVIDQLIGHWTSVYSNAHQNLVSKEDA